MADPLSVTAGIIAALQLSGVVVQYLTAVSDASEDRQRLVFEVSSIRGLLSSLRDLAEGPQHGGSWNTTLTTLATPNGPLDQFKNALKRLESRLAPVAGSGKIWKALTWPFEKGEVKDFLQVIERQKTLFSLALQNDLS